ncbi:MAG TPA: hypothetical protein VN610_08930 [Bryobacteraceae bacterium]|nr:hypothetical protein [Bryobacteraceae bacterium]
MILWAVITFLLLFGGFLALAVTGTSLAACTVKLQKRQMEVHASTVAGKL